MFYARNATLLSALLLAATPSQAAPSITHQSGWSGQINIGAGFGQSETNMLASLSSIDLGAERIDTLNEDAGSEDIGFPVLQFDLNYTLGETQTQFYLRNQPSPYVALDMEVLGGIRQQVTGIGIIDVALSSTTVPADVWKDPYLVGTNRGDTERTTTGLHIAWRNIMDTALSFEFSSKELEIDDEDSGESLALSGRDRRLLERTGEVYRFNVEYALKIGENQRLVPAVSWLDYDLDGAAMAEDGAALRLSHHYQRNRWRIVSGIEYRGLESAEDNPIYGDSADKDVLSLGITAFYERPFGLENWTANVRASWYDADSDIDFYDESLAAFSLGMLYRFD
jgi:hypothetical protein